VVVNEVLGLAVNEGCVANEKMSCRTSVGREGQGGRFLELLPSSQKGRNETVGRGSEVGSRRCDASFIVRSSTVGGVREGRGEEKWYDRTNGSFAR